MGEMDGPFVGSWAVAAGLVTEAGLRSGRYRRVLTDVYVLRGVEVGAVDKARAVALWGKLKGVLVGTSAMAMFGCRYVGQGFSGEIALGSSRHAPAGVRVVRDRIPEYECCAVDGVRVTTPARTGFDLARRYGRNVAVPLLDSLCATTGVTAREIALVAAEHGGDRGLLRMRDVLGLVDARSESPQETKTRLFLIDNGFPRPETQIVVCDQHGRFVARVDMGWKEWQVAIEYDGAQHWTDSRQYARDIDRLAGLEALGWIVIRLSATHLHQHPHLILTRIRRALHSRGCPTG